MNQTGSYTIEYMYTDAAGNTGSVTRMITVTDQTPPVVTLVGSGTQTLLIGSIYTESGATYTDNIDAPGTIPTPTSGMVNTSASGVYTLTYLKVDAAGNTGSTTRTVTVIGSITLS